MDSQTALAASEQGMTWREKSGYFQLGGLLPLVATVRGHDLILADDPELIEKILANLKNPMDREPAALVAGFNHHSEQNNYARLFAVVDRPSSDRANPAAPDRQPQFFSENVGSLSATLGDVLSEEIQVRIEEDKVRQTVNYEWSH
jgi:hypothetical protein